MLVTDRRRSCLSLVDLVAEAVDGGVDAVQLREKDLSGRDLADLAGTLIPVIDGRATLLVNGDIDLASEFALGVHLPELGVSDVEARQRMGDAALIGRSVHTPSAARASTAADYLIAGHVFPTASKPDERPLGLDGLGEIVDASEIPVLAIGGIDVDNVADVIAAGAAGVAVISAIGGSDSPRQAARALRNALEQARGQPMQSDQRQIRIVVNGRDVELPSGTTIAHFLAERGLAERLVVVELNGTIVPRQAFASTALAGGDRAEVVHFVGGG
jgi:thiamine-phosphate pyrophosphorylase